MKVPIKSQKHWERLLNRAKNGNSKAQYDVSSVYIYGAVVDGVTIVSRDFQQHYEWVKKAYENGCIEAIDEYAMALTDGVYCEKNIDLAIELFEKTKLSNSSIARLCLGSIYRDKGEYEKAFAYYKENYELHPDYDYRTLASCYYYGIGVEKDKYKAFELYKKVDDYQFSIDFEIKESNYMRGLMYLEGDEVEKSFEKARFHLNIANRDNDHNASQKILLVLGR